jgi:hypothetical protein
MMNKKINVVHGYLIGVAYIEHGPIFDSWFHGNHTWGKINNSLNKKNDQHWVTHTCCLVVVVVISKILLQIHTKKINR